MTRSNQSPSEPQDRLDDTSALIPVAQAAARIGIDLLTAQVWIRTGEIPGAVTLKGRAWVRAAILDAWLEAARDRAAVRHARPVPMSRDA